MGSLIWFRIFFYPKDSLESKCNVKELSTSGEEKRDDDANTDRHRRRQNQRRWRRKMKLCVVGWVTNQRSSNQHIHCSYAFFISFFLLFSQKSTNLNRKSWKQKQKNKTKNIYEYCMYVNEGWAVCFSAFLFFAFLLLLWWCYWRCIVFLSSFLLLSSSSSSLFVIYS